MPLPTDITNYFKHGGMTEGERYEIERQEQQDSFLYTGMSFYNENGIVEFEETFKQIEQNVLKAADTKSN